MADAVSGPRGAGRPVEVETVYIPEEGRGTLCISSQVGCTLTCTFCHTGTQKLVRNLTPEEILAQFWSPATGWAMARTGHAAGMTVPRMAGGHFQHRDDGHGRAALQFRKREEGAADRLGWRGLSLSKRRITLSTSGVVPEITRTGTEIGVMLAISLHAVRDELRDELVPINKKYPIANCSTPAGPIPACPMPPHHL
jgi:23S rRNA (adenine2503-C2)-methyltransferase